MIATSGPDRDSTHKTRLTGPLWDFLCSQCFLVSSATPFTGGVIGYAQRRRRFFIEQNRAPHPLFFRLWQPISASKTQGFAPPRDRSASASQPARSLHGCHCIVEFAMVPLLRDSIFLVRNSIFSSDFSVSSVVDKTYYHTESSLCAHPNFNHVGRSPRAVRIGGSLGRTALGGPSYDLG